MVTFCSSYKLFVQEKSKKAKDKRAKNVYNHRLGSTGYGGMLYRKVSVVIYSNYSNISNLIRII